MNSETSGHLRRVLGVGFGLAVSIGGTIGVGILRTPGFAVGWTDWLMYCSVLGYLSIAIAEFIGALGLVPGGAIRFLAVLILISIVSLQWLGIRISSQFQEVTTS